MRYHQAREGQKFLELVAGENGVGWCGPREPFRGLCSWAGKREEAQAQPLGARAAQYEVPSP